MNYDYLLFISEKEKNDVSQNTSCDSLLFYLISKLIYMLLNKIRKL